MSRSPTASREQAAEWAVRLDGGVLSAREQGRLQAWLDADPSHADALRRAQGVWRELDLVSLSTAARGEPHAPGQRPRQRHAFRRLRRVAACACVAIVLLGFLGRHRLDVWLHADQRTAVGESRDVPLTGGGNARLDTGSAIAVDDGPQWRDVRVLAGRVSFDVGHADGRPFRVRAGDVVVTDVGTVFQLAHDGEHTNVVVASGMVEVRDARGITPLHAGQQLELSAGTAYGTPQSVDAEAAMAWTRGRIVFEDRPLRDVVDELNRYYDGRIVLFDDDVARRRVSGVFRTAEPLVALRAIQKNLGLRTREVAPGIILLQG